MSICEWFIAYVLPLFCDVSLLSDEVLTDIRTIFALAVVYCAVMLLIILPYKWIMYLLRGGRKKKV